VSGVGCQAPGSLLLASGEQRVTSSQQPLTFKELNWMKIYFTAFVNDLEM
jgi:hypothetical protein